MYLATMAFVVPESVAKRALFPLKIMSTNFEHHRISPSIRNLSQGDAVLEDVQVKVWKFVYF